MTARRFQLPHPDSPRAVAPPGRVRTRDRRRLRARRYRAPWTALAVLILAAAACGTGGGSGTAGAPSAVAPPAGEATATVTEPAQPPPAAAAQPGAKASGTRSGGAQPDAASTIPVLVDIRAAHHPGYDRIVFQFDGPVPQLRHALWRDVVRFDGSGFVMPLHGTAFIEVVLGASAHTDTGSGLTYSDPVRAFGLPNLNHMVSNGDYEAMITLGLGLMKRTTILRTFTLTAPSRYVVDIAADFPQAWARVYFYDEDRIGDGQEPMVRYVLRTVPTPAVATGQLHRFYAGPTPAEKRDRLTLVTSILPGPPEERDQAGFRNLRVANGVADVTLTGTCSSGGSTITVAGELMPMLKYWPTVSHVKIYDSAGTTGNPAGTADSMPVCLEP